MEKRTWYHRGRKLVLGLIIFLFVCYSIRIILAVQQINISVARNSRVNFSSIDSRYNLAAYYLEYEFNEDIILTDSDGVMLTDYSKGSIQGLNHVDYIPGSISQYALYQHQKYLETADEKHLKSLISQADWLVDHQVLNESLNVGLWFYEFPLSQYDIDAHWASSLSQGLAISALIRTYNLTNDEKYIIAAERALNSFKYPVNGGGVAWIDGENIFFEEIPSSTHILNGNIFGLFGVYDFYVATGSEQALQLFNSNVETLEEWLPKYDVGYWSKYSLNPSANLKDHFGIASPAYHELHIDMLRLLSLITKDEMFDEYANKWELNQRQIPAWAISSTYVIYKDLSKLIKKIAN